MFVSRVYRLVVISALVARALSSSGDCARGQGEGATKDKQPDLATAKPDFAMDTDSWQAEWQKDREAARKKYGGKIVELSGVVESPRDDPYGEVGYIYLKVKAPGGIQRCTLDDRAPWLRVGPECTIKIRGIVVSKGGIDGDIHDCVIVESSPNTCIEITAADLAKDFANDIQAANRKYKNKLVIVRGELVSKAPSEADKGRFVYLTLKGNDTYNVKCYLANGNDELRKANDGLKIGTKLKVCGEAYFGDIQKAPVVYSRSGRMLTLE
jgi:hypothetical protein